MSTARKADAPRVIIRMQRWHDACVRRGLLTDGARAAALGVDRSQVYRIQTKACAPGPDFIARACTYFHCPIDALFEVA